MEPLDKPKWFPSVKFLAFYKHQEFDIWADIHKLWFFDRRNNRFIFTDQIDDYLQELKILEDIAKRRGGSWPY